MPHCAAAPHHYLSTGMNRLRLTAILPNRCSQRHMAGVAHSPTFISKGGKTKNLEKKRFRMGGFLVFVSLWTYVVEIPLHLSYHHIPPHQHIFFSKAFSGLSKKGPGAFDLPHLAAPRCITIIILFYVYCLLLFHCSFIFQLRIVGIRTTIA